MMLVTSRGCRSEAVFLEFLRLYFSTMFDVYHTFAITRVASLPGRRSLRSVGAGRLAVPPAGLLAVGTACRKA